MKPRCSRLALLLSVCLWLPTLVGWQDDIEINLRNPYSQFGDNLGMGFFQGANAEVRLGRYLVSPDGHIWRGGVEGDVALFSYGQRWLWHMGLNMETLADDKNDIYFRLVQVYYQALTGVKLKLGPGLFYAGYRHRCNHGTDGAAESRITIRSGLTSSYHWILKAKSIQFDIKPGVNLYVLGQNRDFLSHPRGGLFITTNAVWPLIKPFFMVMGVGANLEMVSESNRYLYFVGDQFSAWRLEPLWAGRLAIRIDQGLVTTDFGLHFAQNLDSGLGVRAQKTNALSFDIDFLW